MAGLLGARIDTKVRMTEAERAILKNVEEYYQRNMMEFRDHVAPLLQRVGFPGRWSPGTQSLAVAAIVLMSEWVRAGHPKLFRNDQ